MRGLGSEVSYIQAVVVPLRQYYRTAFIELLFLLLHAAIGLIFSLMQFALPPGHNS